MIRWVLQYKTQLGPIALKYAQLTLQDSIMGGNILLRSIVEHQDGVEGIVGDHLGGRHGEDVIEARNSLGRFKN